MKEVRNSENEEDSPGLVTNHQDSPTHESSDPSAHTTDVSRPVFVRTVGHGLFGAAGAADFQGPTAPSSQRRCWTERPRAALWHPSPPSGHAGGRASGDRGRRGTTKVASITYVPGPAIVLIALRDTAPTFQSRLKRSTTFCASGEVQSNSR
jgi:hypothetical protein